MKTMIALTVLVTLLSGCTSLATGLVNEAALLLSPGTSGSGHHSACEQTPESIYCK